MHESRTGLSPLPRSFFTRPTIELAVALLGVRLVRRWEDGTASVGVIVETEAYGGPADRASHARAGPTRRNAAMFGPPGHAYVYRVYGLHTCLNVVGAADGGVGAVLVRAVAPLEGIVALAVRRTPPARTAPPRARLAAGPGNVGAAFGIGLELDGADLTAPGPLWLAAPAAGMREALLADGVAAAARVGVAYAGAGWSDRPWRFGVRDHASLSRPFPRSG
ncbi:MAG: mpg, DNA-3-methyladenine glycosylase (3mg), DNA-3-methyladenine glycosylase [Chloroflexi bacterium CSP1-4]|nr:MAG: mpg, DNA-3-methyladenine glycosylase (3mg), DNA-3-methyladenine glycosylase [Chloroflexi bacterium CSP1-4]